MASQISLAWELFSPAHAPNSRNASSTHSILRVNSILSTLETPVSPVLTPHLLHLQVERVDAFVLGLFDLSGSLGHLGVLSVDLGTGVELPAGL